MADVHLPRSLIALYPGAERRTSVEASNVAEVMAALDARWPGMRDRLCEPGPAIREFINVFVDGQPAELETTLGPDAVVHIIPAVAGGVFRISRR
jgi:molybdopterin converting factor small subunit